MAVGAAGLAKGWISTRKDCFLARISSKKIEEINLIKPLELSTFKLLLVCEELYGFCLIVFKFSFRYELSSDL